MSTICVIGGGPAGSTFAARMTQLGHDVCLVERARFPRRHLGESLSPGVLPLLETIGAREAVEAAGFRRVRNVSVKWGGELEVREDAREQGLLVDRGDFDQILLERAVALGTRVLQPAIVRERNSAEGGWSVNVDADGGAVQRRVDFVADASGRSARIAAHRRQTGYRTLALYAYWRGSDLPQEPRIEAGSDEWYWGVPLPDGTYNTLAFVDIVRFRAARSGSLTERFLELLNRSGLMAGCRGANLASAVMAADATPYLDEDCVTPSSIKVGEAALAIDPLSSSGVQKAIQGALAAAVVANTLLRQPGSGDAARRFYRANLTDASERHCRWAAGHYGSVAARVGGEFWKDRATYKESSPLSLPQSRTPLDARLLSAARVELSRQLEFVELPCLDGDFVTVKPTLRHPNLEGPTAYLGGWELAPLLRRLAPGSTPLQIAHSWSDKIPLQSRLAIVGWLLNTGILVEVVPCVS
jgi:flavin-dependent dehydrogenase